MAKNKLGDLRNHLFETLERLKDAEGDAVANEINKAHAISGLAQAIIGSAKLELRAAELLGNGNMPAFFGGEAGEGRAKSWGPEAPFR